MLLFPPLVHPTSPEFPLGVCTRMLTAPGAEITSVVSFTFISVGLTTVALMGTLLTRTCDDETKWLPLIVSVNPCWTCENDTVLGDREPITGIGRALPQSGFNVLLQPASSVTPRPSTHKKGIAIPLERIGDTPSNWGSRPAVASKTSRMRGVRVPRSDAAMSPKACSSSVRSQSIHIEKCYVASTTG